MNMACFIFVLFHDDVGVDSPKCDCACTNEHFRLIGMSNAKNVIKCCEYGILWEFDVFEIS